MPDLSQKRQVDAIKPDPSGRRIVWDSRAGRAGFGLDVWPSGKRSFVYQYRANGRSRRMTLGNCEQLAPKAAEALYLDLAAAVAAGRDPLTERRTKVQDAEASRRARQVAPTVTDVTVMYITSLHAKGSARWRREAERLIEKHIGPALGAKKVQDITTADVRALHEALADTPATANRVRSIMSAVLARAIVDGLHPGPNPAALLDKYTETPRSRHIEHGEWPRLAAAVAAMRAELVHAPRWDTRRAQLDCVVMLLLTGARRDAMRLRRWEDVGKRGRVLRVEPGHKGVETIVLGRAAAAYLRWMRRQADGARGPIFPGQTRDGKAEAPASSLNVLWHDLRTRANLENVTLHDLRRSFATVAGEVGLSEHLIGGLLGHKVPGVTGRYAHRTFEALREAADRVSAEVCKRLRAPRVRA